jgi:endonuclease I
MRLSSRRISCIVTTTAIVSLFSAGLARAQYDAPASYYNSATGTGAALQSQLRTIVSNMTGVNYGNARYSTPYTDTDPNNANNILLIYNRASVSSTWDAGSTWNREHIWPQSRLGASASNGTVNIASDLFNLRPANPGINSSRSNKPFGLDNSTGSYGHVGSYYFPGDADAGDVARSQFYMSTRYSQLTLTDGSPTGLQMGDLSSLLHYHYKDVPDTFERRRNHAIYGLAGENSPASANPYKQSNRNPFVDRPEYAWSVYADQQNDTRLSVGTPDANGGSTANVNLGRVLRGAAVPAGQNVTLNKAGVDGTYYSVTANGAATSTVNGRNNAFTMDTTGSRTIGVGLNASTASAGLKSGSVVVDNLDVTTQGGAGVGANDANDTINVTLSVLDASNSSFATTDTDALSIDFGTLQQGQSAAPIEFSLFNIASSLGADLTAGLDLDSIVLSGDTSVFDTTLDEFTNLLAGSSNAYEASFDTSTIGEFAATYQLYFSDESLPGTVSVTTLTLNLVGEVTSAVPEPGTVGFGFIASASLLIRRRQQPR